MDYQRNSGTGPIKWPYPVDYDKVNNISVDVLIIGGGLAGCCAGIAAARAGASVAIADKAPIRRSGCGGSGMDHWNTVLENPNSPISTEENIEKGRDTGMCHRDYIAVKGTWDALLELERLGIPIRDELDEFAGTPTRDEESRLLKAYDYREMIAVKLRGGQYIKPVLYKGVKEAGCQLFERVMITALLTEDSRQRGRIVGATGFSLTTGEFYVFRCKAAIISSGYACSMWIMNMELTGNSYRWDPNEIGEGLAMAWLAGAEVSDMHNAGSTKGNNPFAWPRFGIGNPSNTWFPCTIVDNNGKEVPWVYADGTPVPSPRARNIPPHSQRYMGSAKSDNFPGIGTPGLIPDLGERIRAGEYEPPFWADLAGMPEEERRSIWGVMIGNEGKSRYTLYDLYTRSGFDPDQDMLMAPIQIPENYMRFGAWFHGEIDAAKVWRTENGGQGEIACDWDLMTNVPGLFVAGASGGLEGCSFACSSGFYAGGRAARFAGDHAQGEVDGRQLEAERERVYAPVRRAGQPDACISWKELWAGTARVMQQCCGEYKTVPILECGLRWLDSIRTSEAAHTYARNPHELVRVLECSTRMVVSSIFLHCCIARIEADKDRLAQGYMFNMLDGDRVKTIYKEKKYWLKAPYAPTYPENYLPRRRAD